MKQQRSRFPSNRGRYYPPVDLIVSSESLTSIRNIGRFRLEPSADCCNDVSQPSTSPVIVENPQEETRWYWKYFLGKEHQNFAGIDPLTKAPFFMSVLIEDEPDGNRICRSILWTSQGPRRLCIPAQSNSSKWFTAKFVLQQFPGLSNYNRSLKEIPSAKVQRELTVLEDQEGGINCKFGVVYALHDQVSDTQMLSNEYGDANFDQFVKLLGQRIDLQDWGSYRGGLDTTTNSTGRESVHTVFCGHEIMFHVSTMLPYSKDNRQQVTQKPH
ncbi:hypothetical protein AB6A40_009566 [Gnathostoma spinigerum]|uniref:Rap-GAP domain-containing protein n=1 Tax=Gnathostoma spinigerum TaxID=75299 RepID=A0ABD6EUR8_9BILA